MRDRWPCHPRFQLARRDILMCHVFELPLFVRKPALRHASASGLNTSAAISTMILNHLPSELGCRSKVEMSGLGDQESRGHPMSNGYWQPEGSAAELYQRYLVPTITSISWMEGSALHLQFPSSSFHIVLRHVPRAKYLVFIRLIGQTCGSPRVREPREDLRFESRGDSETADPESRIKGKHALRLLLGFLGAPEANQRQGEEDVA